MGEKDNFESDARVLIARAREQLTERPDDAVEARHLALMKAALAEERTEAAGAAAIVPRRPSGLQRTKTVLARFSVALATLTGGSAGLAYAGVDLPGRAAEQAFQAVGVDLPNQAEDRKQEAIGTDDVTVQSGKSVADFVRAVIEGWEGDRGCEFGQAVSEAASQNSQGEPAEPEQSRDPCTAGGSASGDGAAAEAGATGAEKSSAGKAKAAEKKEAAEEKKEAAGGDAGATGAEKSSAGKAKAEENRSGAPATTGESDSEEGRSTAADRAGGP